MAGAWRGEHPWADRAYTGCVCVTAASFASWAVLAALRSVAGRSRGGVFRALL